MLDDLTLGHSHFRERFFIDTVTLLNTLHWDTLYSYMVDFWDDDLFWGIVLSSVMDLDFSLEHSHFRWFILRHSHLIHIHIAWGFWFIWTMMRCFRFGTRSRDWLICWHTLAWSSSTVVDSDAPLYIGAYPYFGERSYWFFTLEHLLDDMDHWIISCCPHCILGHSHLVGGFDIEAWLPVCDYCFSMDYGAIDALGLAFSTYLDNLGYLPTFHFILRHFTLVTFILLILP